VVALALPELGRLAADAQVSVAGGQGNALERAGLSGWMLELAYLKEAMRMERKRRLAMTMKTVMVMGVIHWQPGAVASSVALQGGSMSRA